MTHTVEEVRGIAAGLEIDQMEAYGMLTDYADLLEQIERAKDDARSVLVKSIGGYLERNHPDNKISYDAMADHVAKAVAHLLPSQADDQPRVPDRILRLAREVNHLRDDHVNWDHFASEVCDWVTAIPQPKESK